MGQMIIEHRQDPSWFSFTFGTCYGFANKTETEYEIFTIFNDQKGNGDFARTIDWFIETCRNENKDLWLSYIKEDWLRQHLVKKFGFEIIRESCTYKIKK